MKPNINIQRAKDRFHTKTDWLDSYHSFSFGPHYDPENTEGSEVLIWEMKK